MPISSPIIFPDNRLHNMEIDKLHNLYTSPNHNSTQSNQDNHYNNIQQVDHRTNLGRSKTILIKEPLFIQPADAPPHFSLLPPFFSYC